jgi:hypothetical protein
MGLDMYARTYDHHARPCSWHANLEGISLSQHRSSPHVSLWVLQRADLTTMQCNAIPSLCTSLLYRSASGTSLRRSDGGGLNGGLDRVTALTSLVALAWPFSRPLLLLMLPGG